MERLLSGESGSGYTSRSLSTYNIKSSGRRTPAPTTKVLRWKDLEAAVVSTMNKREDISTRSVAGTEEEQHNALSGDYLLGDEYNEIEELFV